jgi:hypothetical protein
VLVMTADIAAVDAPLAQVEADVRKATLLAAAGKTHSKSDRIGDSHASWLVTHPDVTYPIAEPDGWAEQIAAIQQLNDEKRKEAGR